LKKAGLQAVVKAKKPLLTKRHRKERLDFALAHLDWTVEDWKTVVWSDETKINRLGSDGRRWAWKKAGEGLSEGDCEVLGWISDDVGLHAVGGSWICMQD